jgi:hypothetical protein
MLTSGKLDANPQILPPWSPSLEDLFRCEFFWVIDDADVVEVSGLE